MCSQLLYILFSILVLYLIDIYSTAFAVVLCGFLIYFFIQIFSKGSNKDRYIVSLIISLWGGVSYILLVWKHLILLLKNVFTKKDVKAPLQNDYRYHCGETACLEKEINVMLLNISKYYLHSWYDKVGDNEEFVLHLHSVIKETLVNLCSKVTTANRKRISYIVLQIYLHFFIHFVDIKKKSDPVPRVDDFNMKHWACQDTMTEWCYLQTLVSSLINTFGPTSPQKSLHSNHSPILHNFIAEILTEHIFHPLSNLLSDPSQLNSWLLKALKTCVDIDESSLNRSFFESESSVLSVSSKEYNSGPEILLEVDDFSLGGFDYELNEPPHTLAVRSKTVSHVHVCKRDYSPEKPKTSDCLSPLMASGIKSSSNINLLDSNSLGSRGSKSEVCTPVLCDTSTIKRSKSADYIRQMPTLRALNVKDYNIVMQSDNKKMFVALKSDSNSGGVVEQAEEAVEVPTLFSDVRISDTLQHSEAGLDPYTLYCIQYSGVFHDTAKSSDKPHFIKQEVGIKRRFSEFLALQSRLEDNPTLKNCLKGIKRPSKWVALPFSNMDKKNIAERRSFLENYLKELCNQGPIAQSPELQEFLAYGGDATVAFVKKAADISVPRIDKIFVRGVKGAIDMFRTALPNAPVDGGCSPDGSSLVKLYSEDSLPEHRFQEHLLEYSSRDPEMKSHLKHYFKEISNIPYFVQNSRDLDNYPQRASLLRSVHKLKAEECCTCSHTWDLKSENSALEENAFGNVITDLIIESLKATELSSSHLMSIVKLLVSPSIDSFITSLLDGFTEQHLACFLHILHKALWPSENDSKHDERTATSQYPNNYKLLQEYIKVIVSNSNVTMNVSCIQKLVLEQIYLFLSSIQCQQLNRCLLFHLFDVVLETVCLRED